MWLSKYPPALCSTTRTTGGFCVLGIKPGAPGRFAVTVHRVQGATLEGDVHVLLNSEFFADGQAVRRHDTCSTVVELYSPRRD